MALDLSGLSGLTESFADGKPVRKILDIWFFLKLM